MTLHSFARVRRLNTTTTNMKLSILTGFALAGATVAFDCTEAGLKAFQDDDRQLTDDGKDFTNLMRFALSAELSAA